MKPTLFEALKPLWTTRAAVDGLFWPFPYFRAGLSGTISTESLAPSAEKAESI